MYTPKTTPFLHQREARQAGRSKEGFAYLMEMGTGKTKVLIDEAGEAHYNCEITGLLVIAPKGVCATWLRELDLHMNCEYRATVWKSGMNITERKKTEKLSQKPVEKILSVVVMNVEAFGMGTKALAYAKEFIKNHDAAIVIDESQTIKNPSAKRTKRILELVHGAIYRRIATGTPAPNSPLDMYSQLEFISPGSTKQRSYYGFRSRYAVLQEKVFGGRKVKIEVGYRNLDELQKIVSTHSFRVRKEDCLDLPPKMYVTQNVELSVEQKRAYRQMSEEALAIIGRGSFSSSQAAITTLIRLQQIVCGYIRDDDGDLHTLESNRVNAVVDLCEQASSDVIVWVGQHTPVIPLLRKEIENRLGEGSVAEFWGGNNSTREQDAERFKNDENCSVMISTQAAGGRGNTWINANQVIYFANTYNLEERMQSEDRCHRAGQTNHVTYTDLMSEGVNIDERLISALRQKEIISAGLVGEAARDWI